MSLSLTNTQRLQDLRSQIAKLERSLATTVPCKKCRRPVAYLTGKWSTCDCYNVMCPKCAVSHRCCPRA